MDHSEPENHGQQVKILQDQLQQFGDLHSNDGDLQMNIETGIEKFHAVDQLHPDAHAETSCRSIQHTRDTAVSWGIRQRLAGALFGWRYIVQPLLYFLQARQTISQSRTMTAKESVAFPGLLIWMCAMVVLIILKTWLKYQAI